SRKCALRPRRRSLGGPVVMARCRRPHRESWRQGVPPAALHLRPLSRTHHLLRSSMQNIVELVALIAIAALLAWSSFRTWHVKYRIVKWGGAGLLALLSVLLALLSVAVFSTSALTALGMIKQRGRSAP